MNDELSDLPEVLEAWWEREQIVALFNDLHEGATVSHVQVRATKAGTRDKPADGAVTLRDAYDLFLAGDAAAIQIHYEFSGTRWCDTLMPASHLTRIIRTRMP
ncbi:MAG: hypothetical protein KDA92_08245 [Planctomycetales bacterium]|nr:hypothetical protein [Planctomycetales bacterium]